MVYHVAAEYVDAAQEPYGGPETQQYDDCEDSYFDLSFHGMNNRFVIVRCFLLFLVEQGPGFGLCYQLIAVVTDYICVFEDLVYLFQGLFGLGLRGVTAGAVLVFEFAVGDEFADLVAVALELRTRRLYGTCAGA